MPNISFTAFADY